MAARCRRNGRGGRARRTRGAELIEFTLAFLPLIALTFTLLDVAWSVFCKASLQYAVRAGVRRGITVTGAQAAASHSDLTAMVKDTVQRTSLGFLSGPAGLARIKVRYYQPPAPGSSGAVVDVSTQANGNMPLNIMQVSVEGYSLPALLPRFYTWRTAADRSPTGISAVSADLIEPSRDIPPIGTAP